jgi:hypothetical protein
MQKVTACFAYDEDFLDYEDELNVIIYDTKQHFIAEYIIASVEQYNDIAQQYNIVEHYFSSTCSDSSAAEQLAEQIAQLL